MNESAIQADRILSELSQMFKNRRNVNGQTVMSDDRSLDDHILDYLVAKGQEKMVVSRRKAHAEDADRDDALSEARLICVQIKTTTEASQHQS